MTKCSPFLINQKTEYCQLSKHTKRAKSKFSFIILRYISQLLILCIGNAISIHKTHLNTPNSPFARRYLVLKARELLLPNTLRCFYKSRNCCIDDHWDPYTNNRLLHSHQQSRCFAGLFQTSLVYVRCGFG